MFWKTLGCVGIFSLFGKTSVSSSCEGCSDSATCDVTFVESAVYGCGGIWYDEGIENAQYLCGNGYSVCDDYIYASSLGLTYQDCSSNSNLIPTNYYYVSGQSSDGTLNCDKTGNNDLFGCASGTDDGWLYIDSGAINCGPFGAQLSTVNAGNNGWKYGWEPWSSTNDDDDLNELITIKHYYTQSCDNNGDCTTTTEITGGVMCCLQNNDTDTTSNSDTSDNENEIDLTNNNSSSNFNPNGVYDEWRSRSIYQLLTDRFALTDDNSNNNCTELSKYCNGTYQGIVNKLDYIEDLGFDTIWISPIVSNTVNGYHGYWADDIYQLNEHFGNYEDLISLSSELHDRNMYLVVDIVCNHMGYADSGIYNDFTQFVPFNDSIYFHKCYNYNGTNDETTNYKQGCGTTTCDINDYDISAQVEVCRIAGLPDLNDSNAMVNEIFCDWIVNDIINQYDIDGLRIDTVKHVNTSFWQNFMQCVTNNSMENSFSFGEYFSGDTESVSAFQSDTLFASMLSYPMYYQLRNVFLYDYSFTNIYDQIVEYSSYFIDSSLLTGFLDNHDNSRWLCGLTGDDYDIGVINYKNALVFLFTFNNIPILYYGTEQLFDGCNDPLNREPLWISNYDTTNDMFIFIKLLNTIRKTYKLYDYYDSFNVIDIGDDYMIYNRGDNVLVCLTKYSSSSDNDITINIGSNELHNVLQDGIYCDALQQNDCITIDSNNNDDYTIELKNGLSMLYAHNYSLNATQTEDEDDDDDSRASVSNIHQTLFFLVGILPLVFYA